MFARCCAQVWNEIKERRAASAARSPAGSSYTASPGSVSVGLGPSRGALRTTSEPTSSPSSSSLSAAGAATSTPPKVISRFVPLSSLKGRADWPRRTVAKNGDEWRGRAAEMNGVQGVLYECTNPTPPPDLPPGPPPPLRSQTEGGGSVRGGEAAALAAARCGGDEHVTAAPPCSPATPQPAAAVAPGSGVRGSIRPDWRTGIPDLDAKIEEQMAADAADAAAARRGDAVTVAVGDEGAEAETNGVILEDAGSASANAVATDASSKQADKSGKSGKADKGKKVKLSEAFSIPGDKLSSAHLGIGTQLPAMSGMLAKKSSGMVKRWQERFFELRSHYLISYVATEGIQGGEGGAEFKGAMDLHDLRGVDWSAGAMEFKIQLSVSGAVDTGASISLKLRAVDADAAEQWVEALKVFEGGCARAATKQGWLRKSNASRKSVKKRWVVLHDDAMFYYINEAEADAKGKAAAKGVAQLDASTTVQNEELDAKATAKNVLADTYPFEVAAPGRVYWFAAETDEDRIEWVTAIRARLQALA